MPQLAAGPVGQSTQRKHFKPQAFICVRELARSIINPGEFFCPHWGCKTLSTIDNYHRDGDYFLKFQRISKPMTCTVGNCNPVEFKPQSTQDRSWNTGRTWGIRLYVSGGDPGTLFAIQRRAQTSPKKPIGPLTELALPIAVRPIPTR